MWSEDDIRFMQEAHALARSAEGRTSPDPMVGAVIVKDGRILSVGYHGEVTTPHAEAWAIQKAQEDLRGATLYINLEPCCHYGNNPPCADLIVKAGIKEVIASQKDPNPLVNGKGFRLLKKHGIKVRVGLLEKEARALNAVFNKYITTRLPYVLIKSAVTLDGKIATRTGNSRWVAAKEARKFVHHLRNVYDAILVGVGTVLADNPQLTVRMVKKIKNPVRIILDAYARTPLSAHVLKTTLARTLIAVGPGAPKHKIFSLQKKGAEIIHVAAHQGLVDLRELLRKLGEMKITSVLVEGGGEVNASFLKARLVDKVMLSVAPKIFGGRAAKTWVEGEGIALPRMAQWLKEVEITRLGEDLLVSGSLR